MVSEHDENGKLIADRALSVVANGKFLRSDIQDKIDTLSRRGQGQPKNQAIDEVFSHMNGQFRLDNQVLAFRELNFGVPGAEIDLTRLVPQESAKVRADALLFGESQSRVVLSVKPDAADKVLKMAQAMGVPAAKIGTVGGKGLTIDVDAAKQAPACRVDVDLTSLLDKWENSLERALNQT